MSAEALAPDETHPVSARAYRLGNLVVALAVTALAVGLVVSGTSYGLWDTDRPGAGFFPFAVGLVLLLLGPLWVWQSATDRLLREGDSSTPDRRGWLHIVVSVGSVILFALLVSTLGFALTFFGMLLALFWVTARMRWWKAAIAAALTTAFVAFVFRVLLSVPLPASPFLPYWGI